MLIVLINKYNICIWNRFRKKGSSACFQVLGYSRSLLYTLLLTHQESEYLSWSCKALNFLLAIHFNASVTFLLRVLEIL